MPEPADAMVVLTTLACEEEAARLVRALVERQLVACGTLLPGARSIYRWRGAVEDAREVVVLLKTVRDRVPALEQAFSDLHPYELPELLAFPASAGFAPYLAWLAAEAAGPEATGRPAAP